MSEPQYTRCPGCRTIFRVTAAQLAMRQGQVRCGHCKTVFDGQAHLISLAPLPRDEDALPDEAALGPPTVTLRDARALLPPDAPEPPPRATTAAAEDVAEISYEERFAWARANRPSRFASARVAVAIPVLTVLLAAQVVFHYRDALAARVPAARPALARMCDLAGCAIRPLRDIAGMSIDASDLQADPAHQGLLVLTATLRNAAAWPLAWPHLELTLTDAQDRVVVRRALAPAEYAGGTADLGVGIPPASDVSVKLFIDASATTQAGYRLYLFYP